MKGAPEHELEDLGQVFQGFRRKFPFWGRGNVTVASSELENHQAGVIRDELLVGKLQSTHNTRIERIWVEVGTQYARMWRGFFHRLERLHYLNQRNPVHLWLLQYLFLNEINADCDKFQKEWNAHPISGEGHNKSPDDRFFMGQLDNGLYIDSVTDDDLEDIHPDVLQQFYGTTGHVSRRTGTGAGHPADEDSDPEFDGGDGSDSDSSSDSGNDSDIDDLLNAWPDVANRVAADIESNFNGKAVGAPRHKDPFRNEQLLEIFSKVLSEIESQDYIPEGLGMLESEWEHEEYPSVEVIRTGKHGTKELGVSLPDGTWQPRSVIWVQALHIMTRMLERMNSDE
ncbi:hypothetical protein C8J56DRAFT_1126361 [Mycena floridula]|nr:hypothetical protein C8J56DRAFT_1126361 [Mycena floridula]